MIVYEWLSWLSPIFDLIGAVSVLGILLLYLSESVNWSIFWGYRPTAIVFGADFSVNGRFSPCVLMVKRKDGLGGEWIFPQCGSTNSDPGVVAERCLYSAAQIDRNHFMLRSNLNLGRIRMKDRGHKPGIRRNAFSLFKYMRGKHYIGYISNLIVGDIKKLSPGCENAEIKLFSFDQVTRMLDSSFKNGDLSLKKYKIYKKGMIELENEFKYYKKQVLEYKNKSLIKRLEKRTLKTKDFKKEVQTEELYNPNVPGYVAPPEEPVDECNGWWNYYYDNDSSENSSAASVTHVSSQTVAQKGNSYPLAIIPSKVKEDKSVEIQDAEVISWQTFPENKGESTQKEVTPNQEEEIESIVINPDYDNPDEGGSFIKITDDTESVINIPLKTKKKSSVDVNQSDFMGETFKTSL